MATHVLLLEHSFCCTVNNKILVELRFDEISKDSNLVEQRLTNSSRISSMQHITVVWEKFTVGYFCVKIVCG